MFEHRLKVFLVALCLVTLTLLLRAAYVQVVDQEYWKKEARDALTDRSPTDTMRGTIFDVKGFAIAVDEQCVDACFDFRALAAVPDKDWVLEVARARLRERLNTAYTEAPLARRKVLVEDESRAVLADHREMWARLEEVTGTKLAKIEDARQAVVEKVRMRRRWVWYYNYLAAMDKHKAKAEQAQTQPSSGWQRWLMDDTQDAPELDSFVLRVFEESAPHMIVHDVPPDVQTELGKNSERFPGLSLRPGNRRFYPFGSAAAHVLGRVSRVTRDDTGTNDPNRKDELRAYQPNDLKGRAGLEGLCENELRGVRGEVRVVDGKEVLAQKPERGKNVTASIHIELQQEVEALFDQVPLKANSTSEPEFVAMHGAAVVIDVPSGEVRVLASAPGFDPNRFDEQSAELLDLHNLDLPLMNRATSADREPGSTVKPIVGIAGVASGLRKADEGYECTGYMISNGKPVRGIARCWVASMFHNELCRPDCTLHPCPNVAHHRLGKLPHPTGFLTLADALERSCNPYFESIAHGLGAGDLSDWYRRFGLGEKTGIGIREAAGLVPDHPTRGVGPGAPGMRATWTAGIGQGPVAATPIQMANVAATIARGGVWLRPTLIASQSAARPVLPKLPNDRPDRVDLNLPPEALRAVREGMFRVVHTAAGSGNVVRRPDFAVAGKTGTAQAAWVLVDVIDAKTGKPVFEEKDGKPVLDRKGKPKAKQTFLKISNPGDINPDAKWYRGTGREGGKPHHSWFIGYAPAENPQIAFAVLVEYGGSGGGAAGAVAKSLVQKCVEHGVLTVPAGGAVVSVAAATETGPVTAPALTAAATDELELGEAESGEAESGVVANRAASVAAPFAPAAVELLHDVPATQPATTRAAE